MNWRERPGESSVWEPSEARVAKLARSFGCRVIYYSTSGRNTDQPYERVEFQEILAQADILSIHAPLNGQTEGLINREALRQMKKTAILINVGRGPIVAEADLADALEAGEIRAAGLDVLAKEPMDPENPLLRIQDSSRLLITPHMAWTPVETRRRVMREIERLIRGSDVTEPPPKKRSDFGNCGLRRILTEFT